MNRNFRSDRSVLEGRFAEVFAHLDSIASYARSRGARDPENIAAEVMAIAWRRLADVPVDDARPWLMVTTRNLLLVERRTEPKTGRGTLREADLGAPAEYVSGELDLDPELARALHLLPPKEREALLLIAWDDLTPALAAASLGISAAAFRVRLHRARRRLGSLVGTNDVVSPVSASQPHWRQT